LLRSYEAILRWVRTRWLDNKTRALMQDPAPVVERVAFRNETGHFAAKQASGAGILRALEPPLAASHPQRLAPDPKHPRELGFGVRILKALDNGAYVFLDRERSRAAGQRHRGAHHRQRRRNFGEIASVQHIAFREDHRALD